MSGWVPYSMHSYPYSCTGPATLILHNLPGNWGKSQHSLEYLRAVGPERTAGRELFSCGVWTWRCCSPCKSLIQSCNCRRGRLNTRLFTLLPCKRNFSGTEALCWQHLVAETSKLRDLGLNQLFRPIWAFWVHCRCWGAGQQWLHPVMS